jgi:hypothetical protein
LGLEALPHGRDARASIEARLSALDQFRQQGRPAG